MCSQTGHVTNDFLTISVEILWNNLNISLLYVCHVLFICSMASHIFRNIYWRHVRGATCIRLKLSKHTEINWFTEGIFLLYPAASIRGHGGGAHSPPKYIVPPACPPPKLNLDFLYIFLLYMPVPPPNFMFKHCSAPTSKTLLTPLLISVKLQERDRPKIGPKIKCPPRSFRHFWFLIFTSRVHLYNMFVKMLVLLTGACGTMTQAKIKCVKYWK